MKEVLQVLSQVARIHMQIHIKLEEWLLTFFGGWGVGGGHRLLENLVKAMVSPHRKNVHMQNFLHGILGA